MEKNYNDFNIREARRFANSDAGKQLMALLKDQHGGQMQAVMDNVKSGNIEQAMQSLATFMEDPKTKMLLKQLQEVPNERNGE